MLRTFSILLFISATIFITSCTDSISDIDYREQWVGTYEGVKSNRSFEDTMFTTPISFDVTLDADSADGLTVNGITFPISEEGTFGPGFLDGGFTNYELTIDGDDLRLMTGELIPNGISIACFITGTKN